MTKPSPLLVLVRMSADLQSLHDEFRANGDRDSAATCRVVAEGVNELIARVSRRDGGEQRLS
jgi:hypothetical protein